ncbi:BnaCnng63020D [Brassica napus]|uniref:BnaCnng63020D protein n=1 Tax=Brassica napus TaxID=3708 RepID=A0A078JRB0_BRANA|nr:BnaCnng63020D [Brassica napus]
MVEITMRMEERKRTMTKKLKFVALV